MKNFRFVPMLVAFALVALEVVLLMAQPDPVSRASLAGGVAGSQELFAGTGEPLVVPASQEVKFANAVPYDSGAPYAFSIAVADVNGDGKLDLLVANQCPVSGQCDGNGTSEATVGVLLGNGNGTFQAAVVYGSGGIFASSVAVADVNGDGVPDLLVTNLCDSFPSCSGDSTVGVLLGNGNGTFQTAETYDSGGYGGNSIAVGDVNGDGIPDLIVANECVGYGNCANGGEVSILLGNGNGTFQPAVTYDLGGLADSVAVADVNGDGNLDLLVASFCATGGNCADGQTIGTVAVLLGNGDGTFEPPTNYGTDGYGNISVAVADVNGDGNPDLLVTNQCGTDTFPCPDNGTVGVLLGKGNGTFQTVVTYGSGGYEAFSVTAADLDGSGNLDLIVANLCASYSNCAIGAPRRGAVGVLLGNGDGTFQTATAYESGGSIALSAAVADLKGDGRPDVAVVNETANKRDLDGSIGVLLNKTSYSTTTALTSSPNPSQVNQSVTFTATITPTPPNGELVTFYNGKTNLGTGATTNGVASLTTSFSKAATYTIKADYPGDAFRKASHGTVSQVVN